uniref:non-specific serine/threonine protein kinase n=1 Tax=Ciona savignyi TaxID=51511 RepID=H2Y4G8_CIOSA
MTSDSSYLRSIGYLLGGRINSGSFSHIHHAIQVSNADVVAVKVIDLKNINIFFRTRFLPRELMNIRTLDHPNIIQVRKIAETDSKVYIIMDYAFTNLRIQIMKHCYIPEEQARHWFCQLASALEYMHRRGVAHRDIKLENILIDQHNTIKLCDFGFSKMTDRRSGILPENSTTYCGSLGYCAPEILRRTPYDPWKSDIWSLGVVLYRMVVGGMPFGEGNDLGSVKRISIAQSRSLEFPTFPKTSVECQELIRRLLTVESDRRITLLDISKSRWVNHASLNSAYFRHQQQQLQKPSQPTPPTEVTLGGNDVIRSEINASHGERSMISRIRMRLPVLNPRKNKRKQMY